MLLTSLMRYQK